MMTSKSFTPAAPAASERKTILLVDDEPLLLGLGRTILEQADFRVLTAADEEEALGIYRQHADEIALVILDLRMPKLDGLQTLRQLKRLKDEVKVAMMTGSWTRQLEAEALAEGAREVLMKPYTVDELTGVVWRALASGLPAVTAGNLVESHVRSTG